LWYKAPTMLQHRRCFRP